jgi:fumarate hydratase class I
VIDYADLGMEAVRLVTVKNLQTFVLINDRGEDFYADLSEANPCR